MYILATSKGWFFSGQDEIQIFLGSIVFEVLFPNNILLPPFLVREKKSENAMMSDVRTQSGIFILGVFVDKSLWSVMTSKQNFTKFGWMKD